MEEVPLYFPTLCGPTKVELAAAHAIIAKYEEAVEKVNQGALIKCVSQSDTDKGCGEIFPIADVTYIQTYWNTTSIFPGGYWYKGEGNCICPKCGHRIRFYKSSAIENLKKYFKCVKDEHKD